MATSAIHNGWKWDRANSRLEFYYRGTKIGYLNTNGMTFESGKAIDLSAATGMLSLAAGEIAADDIDSGAVTKAKLNSEVYTIEHIVLAGSTNDFNDQTVTVSKLWSAGTVVRVVYFTSAALGASMGIDILDGGTDGSGTDVIDSCSDNLNGLDANDLTTPYSLSAGDYVNVKFDAADASVDFVVDIQIKVPVSTAT